MIVPDLLHGDALTPVEVLRTGVPMPFGVGGLAAIRAGQFTRSIVSDNEPVLDGRARSGGLQAKVLQAPQGASAASLRGAYAQAAQLGRALAALADGSAPLGDSRDVSNVNCPSSGSGPGVLCEAAKILRAGRPVIMKVQGLTVAFSPPAPYRVDDPWELYRDRAAAGVSPMRAVYAQPSRTAAPGTSGAAYAALARGRGGALSGAFPFDGGELNVGGLGAPGPLTRAPAPGLRTGGSPAGMTTGVSALRPLRRGAPSGGVDQGQTSRGPAGVSRGPAAGVSRGAAGPVIPGAVQRGRILPSAPAPVAAAPIAVRPSLVRDTRSLVSPIATGVAAGTAAATALAQLAPQQKIALARQMEAQGTVPPGTASAAAGGFPSVAAAQKKGANPLVARNRRGRTVPVLLKTGVRAVANKNKIVPAGAAVARPLRKPVGLAQRGQLRGVFLGDPVVPLACDSKALVKIASWSDVQPNEIISTPMDTGAGDGSTTFFVWTDWGVAPDADGNVAAVNVGDGMGWLIAIGRAADPDSWVFYLPDPPAAKPGERGEQNTLDFKPLRDPLFPVKYPQQIGDKGYSPKLMAAPGSRWDGIVAKIDANGTLYACPNPAAGIVPSSCKSKFKDTLMPGVSQNDCNQLVFEAENGAQVSPLYDPSCGCYCPEGWLAQAQGKTTVCVPDPANRPAGYGKNVGGNCDPYKVCDPQTTTGKVDPKTCACGCPPGFVATPDGNSCVPAGTGGGSVAMNPDGTCPPSAPYASQAVPGTCLTLAQWQQEQQGGGGGVGGQCPPATPYPSQLIPGACLTLQQAQQEQQLVMQQQGFDSSGGGGGGGFYPGGGGQAYTPDGIPDTGSDAVVEDGGFYPGGGYTPGGGGGGGGFYPGAGVYPPRGFMPSGYPGAEAGGGEGYLPPDFEAGGEDEPTDEGMIAYDDGGDEASDGITIDYGNDSLSGAHLRGVGPQYGNWHGGARRRRR